LKTPDECVVDAVFGKVEADRHKLIVAEVKAREMELQQSTAGRRLRDTNTGATFDTYLISHNKVAGGLQLANLLSCSFFVFVKLIGSDLIVYWKVSDPVVQHAIKRAVTATRACVNGGTKSGENAFIPVSMMGILNEARL